MYNETKPVNLKIVYNMKFQILFSILFFFCFSIAEAQLREDLNRSSDYTGAISHTQESSGPGDWMNLLNMTMNHSYSMTFSNFGGQMQNINAYTNSMLFDISENVDAQVDVSFLHSPFGNNFMANDNLGSRIIIDRARLDYQLSQNTSISVEFSQRPYYSPYGGGFGYGSRHHSPFNRYSTW